MVFDYERKQVILQRNQLFGQPFEADMAGVRLAAEGADVKAIRIRDVLPGSPADESGLRVGDTLVAIDGMPSRDLDLEQIRAMLKREGRTCVLDLVRPAPTIRRNSSFVARAHICCTPYDATETD